MEEEEEEEAAARLDSRDFGIRMKIPKGNFVVFIREISGGVRPPILAGRTSRRVKEKAGSTTLWIRQLIPRQLK